MSTQLVKDHLRDIVKHGLILGPETILKVEGEDGNILVRGKRDDGSMMVEAKIKTNITDFDGTFGLSNLSLLSNLINLESFVTSEGKVDVIREDRNGQTVVTQINFSNAKSAKASYRLTGELAIPRQVSKKSSGLDDAIVIEKPSKKKINELRQVSSIFAGVEDAFGVKVEDGNLVFLIGQEHSSTHKAKVVFAENVVGSIPTGYLWSVADVLNILKLSETADCLVSFNAAGNLLEIKLNTGLGDYTFMLPGKN